MFTIKIYQSPDMIVSCIFGITPMALIECVSTSTADKVMET